MSSLTKLKVLDLTTHLSGPYCSMILADHGADVVKVENPNGGDPLRHSPPFQEGESAPFMLWNRNKRSVALDLKSEDDLRSMLGSLSTPRRPTTLEKTTGPMRNRTRFRKPITTTRSIGFIRFIRDPNGTWNQIETRENV